MTINLGAILITVIMVLLAWFLWQEVSINRAGA